MPSQNIFRAYKSTDDSVLGVSKLIRYVETGKDTKDIGKIRIKRNDGKKADDLLAAVLISSITHDKSVACQPEPTISGHLYLNYFGDKPTSYTLNGMAYDHLYCDAEGTGVDESGGTGISFTGAEPLKAIVEFYEDFKLKLDKELKDQVVITTYDTLGGTYLNYVGILTQMNLTVSANTDGSRRFDFVLTFIAIE